MPRDARAPVSALQAVTDWDVPAVAGAVFDASGVRETVGDSSVSFALASLSKVLTAIAVQVAVEEGTVDLDAPAGPPGSTVRHLLAHASGLAPDSRSHDDVLAEPGARRIYSNAGFDVLVDHLAGQTGMDGAEYLRLALVDSLALTATDVSGSPAHGHRSSVDDLATVLHAVVAGRLLAAGTVETLVTPAFPDLAGVLPGFGRQDPNPWGLGVEVRGEKSPHWTAPTNSPRTWGHFGRAGTFCWFDPDAGIGTVVLTDREFGPWAIEAWPELSWAILAEHADSAE